jgi:hypothetical protein
MFAHKSVPHLSSQRALARMAKTLSFNNIMIIIITIMMTD